MTKKLRCAVYVRVVSRQEAGNPCQIQCEKVKAYIARNEAMQYYKTFVDEGCSGAHLRRPALQQLLGEVRHHKCDLVISDEFHRLTRSPHDFYNLVDVFDAHGVRFMSIKEQLDTATPAARSLRDSISMFTQLEKETMSEETCDARRGV